MESKLTIHKNICARRGGGTEAEVLRFQLVISHIQKRVFSHSIHSGTYKGNDSSKVSFQIAARNQLSKDEYKKRIVPLLFLAPQNLNDLQQYYMMTLNLISIQKLSDKFSN